MDEREGDQFLERLIRRVPDDLQLGLNKAITLNELTEAMRSLNLNKVSGIDWLPLEFYLTFWDILGQDFVEVVNFILNRGVY